MRSLITLLLFIFFQGLTAQVINATVKVEYPRLTPEEKIPIENFAQRIQDFINDVDWVPDPDPQIPIDVNITVIIQTVSEGNQGYVYTSQFLISSTAGESFYDKSWEFTYLPDEYYIFPNPSPHPIITFLHYYVLMIIAGELDTYSELGGNEAYVAALNMCQQARISLSGPGWALRKELVETYLHEFTTPLRKAKLVFYDALNAYQNGNVEDQLKFGEECLALIEQAHRFASNSLPVQLYMNRNARQIAMFFAPSSKRTEYFERLVTVDARFKSDYAKILGVDG